MIFHKTNLPSSKAGLRPAFSSGCVGIKLNGECFAAKNVHFLSLVKVNSENLPLKDYSSFDSPRYDCVLFVSLIKLNGECIAAKNVVLMSLVKVNSENLALKDYSSFDSPRYDCVLFMSLIKLNGECIAA